ncbi:MAG: aminotransferase class I/II-fold pyridoxal phosphate-dependent enzyme, partial [Elusimicrobiota bacterium]
MNVPFLDLKAQISLIRPEIDSAINQIINNTNFIGGPVLKDFESLFAKACGTNYGIGTSSGTSAIHMALHALGIGKGDEVIVPANTFIATAEPVVQCGARPVFVDVDPETALMLPDVVEKAITSKTKAIILVHLYGQLVQMSPFLKISEK